MTVGTGKELFKSERKFDFTVTGIFGLIGGTSAAIIGCSQNGDIGLLWGILGLTAGLFIGYKIARKLDDDNLIPSCLSSQ